MRHTLTLFALLFTLLFISSCKDDFEVNEEWKEIDIVYGLLDKNDTVHYIKIGKAFLNNDESAYKIAAIEDSIFHRDTLDVMFQEIKNNTVQNEIKLQKTYLSNKDSGLFAAPGQFLYQTNYKLKSDAAYKLVVKNASTGVSVSSQTQIVDDITDPNPNSSSRKIPFRRNSYRAVSFIPGKGAKFYELIINIHYTEYAKKDSSKIKDAIVRWPIFTNLTTNPNGGNRITYNLKGDDFYRTMLDNITADNDVYRKIGDLDFEITAGGEEIYNYISVYRPSIGIVQKKPEYTNIENGQGIFSSRNRTKIIVGVDEATVLELATGVQTSQLNFIK